MCFKAMIDITVTFPTAECRERVENFLRFVGTGEYGVPSDTQIRVKIKSHKLGLFADMFKMQMSPQEIHATTIEETILE